MNTQQVDDLLKKTFEDQRLSKGEKSDLIGLLTDNDAESDDVNMIRNRAFIIARGAVTDGHAHAAVNWLEDVIRGLKSYEASLERGVTSVADALFSPGEAPRNRIASLISNAQRSIDACVFTITDNHLSDALRGAHRRGVAVRLITDDDKAWDKGSDAQDLGKSGIPVRMDRTDAHMHNKFAVFDGHLLLNGSYNWTRSAFKANQENIVVTDSKALVGQFQVEFERLWGKFE